MTNYIETVTGNGTPLRIEIKDTTKTGAGFSRQSAQDQAAAKAAQDAYNQTLKTIQACANGVIDTIQNLDSIPSSASVDFAIKIDAEAGAMLSASGEGSHFKVSLSWQQETDDKKDEE